MSKYCDECLRLFAKDGGINQQLDWEMAENALESLHINKRVNPQENYCGA